MSGFNAVDAIADDILQFLTAEERAELKMLVEADLAARPLLPQAGPQQQFVEATADIVVYGGAAYGGKTWALLYKPLQHLRSVPGFYAVLFRRTVTQLTKPGANWDESMSLYPRFGGLPTSHKHEWYFPGGGKLKMDGLEYDSSVLDWQTAQVAALLFDELTHFTKKQFFYMISRNRSMCGVKPYVRAACNPDADSWVAEFLAWWIDQDTGFAIPERAGVVRWFVRAENDALVWADTAEELVAMFGPGCEPKSVTFIPAKATDNKIGMAKDPGYLANLKAQDAVERGRLLGGNWKIRAAAGLLFQRGWCRTLAAAPLDLQLARGWDLAGTPKTETNDPDWTVGVKIGRRPSGVFVVTHVARFRATPFEVKSSIRHHAEGDGQECEISLPQDPGQAGKSQVADLISDLAGFNVRSSPETGDKVTRFSPFSAQAEAGNVEIVKGPWYDEFCSELEGFPDARHDDCADAGSRALRALTEGAAKPRVRAL